MLNTLKILSLFFFLFAFPAILSGQRTIEEYKTLADQFMSAELDNEVMQHIQCKDYMSKVNDTLRYAGDYATDKKKTLPAIEWIGFFYCYYSPQLNYEFHFYLTINATDFVGPATMLGNTFPKCIRENGQCNLISKDSAIRIAQNDSIKYPGNVYVALVRPKNSEDFFWAIYSQDPAFVDYNSEPRDGLDHPIMPWREKNTRLINAGTGRIICLRDYWALNK